MINIVKSTFSKAGKTLSFYSLIYIIFGLLGKAATPTPYSGKLSINSINYNGSALFYFSIVDENSTAHWSQNDNLELIKVTVENGRYFVLLGGQGMDQIPSELFINQPKLYLKVSVNIGDGKGLRLLSPNQLITSTPYAMAADYARIAKNVELNAGLTVKSMIPDSIRDNILIKDANPTISFEESDSNYPHSLTLDGGKFNISSFSPNASGGGTQEIYPLKLDTPASKAYAYGNEIITTANIGSHAAASGDRNNSITHTMLSSTVRADLNRTITRSMLASDVQTDLNRTITHAMLSTAVRTDLNRTITRSMLASAVQTDLNRTITRSMLSSAVQADLNTTVTPAQLSSSIARHFKPAITTQPQPTNVNSDTNGTISVVSSGRYLSYQWKKNGSALMGETNSTHFIVDANATLHEGNYTVVVTNDFGSVESSSAEVLVPNPPVQVLSTTAGSNTGNMANSWQRILLSAANSNHTISSIQLELSGSATVYLEVYSQSSNVSTNPNTRFAGLTAVATSNSKTFSNGSYSWVSFDFPSGTTLNSNPPYYIWAKSNSGSPSIKWGYQGGGTTGGNGNNPGNLNHKVYGIAP